jgi:hypothetical protein
VAGVDREVLDARGIHHPTKELERVDALASAVALARPSVPLPDRPEGELPERIVPDHRRRAIEPAHDRALPDLGPEDDVHLRRGDEVDRSAWEALHVRPERDDVGSAARASP